MQPSSSPALVLSVGFCRGKFGYGTANFELPYSGKRTLFSVAEEVFDLTNNPSRWEEFCAIPVDGDRINLSSGDLFWMEVNGVTLHAVCKSEGWRVVPKSEVLDWMPREESMEARFARLDAKCR